MQAEVQSENSANKASVRKKTAAAAAITTTTTTTTTTDILSASKVVINMVKQKFDKRLAALEMAEASHTGLEDLMDARRTMNKCPMLDGSLDQYIQDWDQRLFDPVTSNSMLAQDVSPVWEETGLGEANTSGTGSQPLVYHDLWATMTMGWSQDGRYDVGSGG